MAEEEVPSRLPGIVIGRGWRTFTAGDEISLIGTITPARPKYRRFGSSRSLTVVCLGDTSLLISLPTAQRFSISAMRDRPQVKVDDVDRAPRWHALRRELGFPYWTRDWTEMNRNLALRVEKVTMFVIWR
jgi:lipoprotein-releasing system permease protein